MYAVVRTGGKQYKVAPGERLKIERIPADVGAADRSQEVGNVHDAHDVVVRLLEDREATVMRLSREIQHHANRRANRHADHLGARNHDFVGVKLAEMKR